MKIYGETNDVPGLIAGPIEVRFRRLREHTGADVFLLWTTPERWAAGEAISLWIPAMGLALECKFEDGRLVCDKARPTTQEERDPRRQRSAIGMELRPERIELPTGDNDGENPSASLVAAFERLLDRRWTSFVDPLREALEAEARDDTARAERLATSYQVATPRIGSQSESDPYRLSGVEASAVAAFDEGEWLDLVDTRGRVISSARLVRIDPAEGVMDVDVRGADPPSEGVVRPRPQTQILAQKRAILEELDNPTGGLANAVKLVASPASLTPPNRKRPATFVNRLVAQNRSQVRAVSLALGLEEGQALMIQGPPGTGKSTTLAEVLGQLVMRDKNVTVLVCSHSNHGVDNLLLKTLPYLESIPELAIARVGLFDRVNPAARPHYVPPGEDLGAFNVVFTTVDALALQVEAGARTYDYAVLDEANRASILDSLIPLVRGRRFVLVGDHLQLQPVLSEAEEALRLEPAVGNTSAIGKSLFAWLRERRFPEAATVFLDEQNRMHPVIAGLISEVFYEGKLRSGRRAPRRVADVPLFPAAVTWVDTRGLHGLREARGRGASLVNVPEARLVATIARHILSSSTREVDVGVISAYAEQTALLRRLLLHRNNQRQNSANGTGGNKNVLDRAALKHLEIDTVDAFEGREKDIILVSLVRSNRRRDIGFLRLMQRINVALSRARTMLIVVGDTSTLRGSYFDRIVRYIRANGMLVPGPRLIGRLLNARTGERPERAGAAVAGPGRRRRPLPSPRTAFPERDPAAAAEGTTDAAAGEGRNKRRRRRVRGRPGSERPGVEQRGAPPSTTMEMTPSNEPGLDEPATQYEIDRFAALVEQLLGEGASDDAAPQSGEGAVPEVDRAHAEEVLADALRAVGEQERGGSSRSRRGNNRRRGRRGQGRPLPGDAAVADAARRQAEQERLAGALPVEGEPPLLDDGYPRTPEEQPESPAAAASVPAFRPADEPAPGGFGQLGEPPARPFVPADQPPVPAAEPARPRRTRRRPAADVGPEIGAAEATTGVPAPIYTPAAEPPIAPPAAASVPSEPAPPAEPASPVAPAPAPRRTRRRVAAAEPAAAAEAPSPAPAPTLTPTVEPAPMALPPAATIAARPADEASAPSAPVRRTRRRTAATAEEAPAPAAVITATTSDTAPTEAPPATEAPRRTTRRRVAAASAGATPAVEPALAATTGEHTAAPAPAPSPESPVEVAPASAPAVGATPPPAPRTRRRSAASAAMSASAPAPAPTVEAGTPAPPAPRARRRTTAATPEAAPVPEAASASAPEASPPAAFGAPPAAEAASEPAPTRARVTRRRATPAPAPAATDAVPATTPAVAAPPPAPAEPPAPPATAETSPAPARGRHRAAASVETASAESVPPAPKPRRTRKATANATALPSETPAANGSATHGPAEGDAPAEAAPAPKVRRTRRKAADTAIVEAPSDG